MTEKSVRTWTAKKITITRRKFGYARRRAELPLLGWLVGRGALPRTHAQENSNKKADYYGQCKLAGPAPQAVWPARM